MFWVILWIYVTSLLFIAFPSVLEEYPPDLPVWNSEKLEGAHCHVCFFRVWGSTTVITEHLSLRNPDFRFSPLEGKCWARRT